MTPLTEPSYAWNAPEPPAAPHRVEPAAPDVSEGGIASDADQSLAPRVQGYQIHELLGRGGMGAVWRATELSTKRQVAVKILGMHTLGSRRARVRFEREISLASRLEHPGIARVYNNGTGVGTYFYVMELIEGKPLNQFVEARRLDQRRIIELMIQVIEAVSYAHLKGVIHRDLKPSNILVDGRARPHILDFGLATADDVVGLTVVGEGSPIGTLTYMPPEQARGQVDAIDTRSDLYSIGVMLFECLTGSLPYASWETRLELENRVTRHEVRRARAVNPRIGRDLEAILNRCLAQRPDQRYASADALAQDLRACLRGEPVSAVPLTLPYILSRRLRRHWQGVTLAALIAGVLLGGAVYSYLKVQHERNLAVLNERRATQARDRAQRLLYFNQITQAQTLLRSGRRAEALAALDQTDPARRNAEWAYLRHEADSSAWTSPPFDGLLACHLDGQRQLTTIDQHGQLQTLPLGATTTDPPDPADLPDVSASQQLPMPRVTSATFSRDGRYLALRNTDRWLVWDREQQAPVAEGPNDDGGNRPMAFNTAGDTLMLGARPSKPVATRLLCLTDGAVSEHLPAAPTGRIPRAVGAWDCIIEPQAQRLILLDAQMQPRSTITLPGTPTGAIATHDQKILLGLDDGRVAIVDPENLESVSTRLVDPDEEPIRSLAAHQDWAFATASDGRIFARPLADRRVSVEFGGHIDRVHWIKVLDGRWLIAADVDAVKAWDLSGSLWELSHALQADGRNDLSFAALDNGEKVVVAGIDGRVRAARLGEPDLLWETLVGMIIPATIHADEQRQRIFICGGRGWAVLNAQTGEVMAHHQSDRPHDIVPLDGDAVLVSDGSKAAHVVDLHHLVALRDPVPIRRPFAWRSPASGKESLVFGVDLHDPHQLVVLEPGPGADPQPIAWSDDPIQSLGRPSADHITITTPKGQVMYKVSQRTFISSQRQGHNVSWSTSRDRAVLLSIGQAYLVENLTDKPVLAFELSNIRDVLWLEDRLAWLAMTGHGLRLIPAKQDFSLVSKADFSP